MKQEVVKSKRRRWLKQLIQLSIFAVCVWGIWQTVVGAQEKFAAARFSPSELNPGWLAIAGAAYLLGMLPCCFFWYRTLRVLGQRPQWSRVLAAFYIGHLGKYVPGKALVVVIRTAMIQGPGVVVTVAATSVFVETLTMMAVGAFVSAAIIALQVREQTGLLLLAVSLALCAGVPTLPPVFRHIVSWIQLRRADATIDQAVSGLDLRLMLVGWPTIALGWFLIGFSLWATLKAIPASGIGFSWDDLLLTTSCVALAMVAGFLSLLPGGVGVREIIVMQLLAPVFGEVVAIVSAVAIRIVWLASELLLAGLLYGYSWWQRSQSVAHVSQE